MSWTSKYERQGDYLIRARMLAGMVAEKLSVKHNCYIELFTAHWSGVIRHTP